MTELQTVRVAAIQATPVILDAEACIEKAVVLLQAAADEGVELAVLPETFDAAGHYARADALSAPTVTVRVERPDEAEVA